MPTTAQTKPFKTYREQIELLRARGLIIYDDAYAEEVLKRLNYYRLSAYSLTLRKNDRFYPGVTLDDVAELYAFDHALRRLLFQYSSIVEVSARAYISYYHAQKYGPLGYLNLKPSVKLPSGMRAVGCDSPAAYIYAVYALLPDEDQYAMLQDLTRIFHNHPFALPRHLGLPPDWKRLFAQYGNG